ncbi:MAG TPA: dephospho-CoA kinase [Bryobacteraceae bacterium]|nr:dephospho-CoA kinase [Bryobacteraceae bacterium]
MLIAGLTGGLATGKSFVAAALHRLGAYVIEADALGHEVLQPGTEAYSATVTAFGSEILDEDGRIDRPRLAAAVFGNPAALETLNAIVHPAVRERAAAQFQAIAQRDPHAVVIYVAAILIETGGHRDVDKLILVTCSREQQIARALERPAATLPDVLARLDRQYPLDRKLPFADYVIDTSGAKEDTLRQTKMVFEDLKNLAI